MSLCRSRPHAKLDWLENSGHCDAGTVFWGAALDEHVPHRSQHYMGNHQGTTHMSVQTVLVECDVIYIERERERDPSIHPPIHPSIYLFNICLYFHPLEDVFNDDIRFGVSLSCLVRLRGSHGHRACKPQLLLVGLAWGFTNNGVVEVWRETRGKM